MSSEEKRSWIYVVVGVGVAAIVPLALAMAEAAHFWTANTLYLAFVLAALASSIAKIVLCRWRC